MKFCTVIGARPNFTKMAPLLIAIEEKGHENIVIHTGQHYDANMSDIFLNELEISFQENLEIGSGTHGYQTGMMIIEIEKRLMENDVDFLLVPGDTNSALSGALAAAKLRIPIAHVEAGLRSFDREMPEEINRILIDHCSDVLFCPTETAVENLKNEGISDKKIYLTGDTMVEASAYFSEVAHGKSGILDRYSLSEDYFVATVHRAENTDNEFKLKSIVEAFLDMDSLVVFPLHPRTKARLEEFGLFEGLVNGENILIIEPLGYIDFLNLIKNAKLILTDSGGLQKEAFLLKVPCITLRENTEWVETLDSGWNVLAGSDKSRILSFSSMMLNFKSNNSNNLFGDGKASEKIIETLEKYHE